MTKTEALYKFFNSFGLKAYPTTAVPETETFPYIAYEVQTNDFEGLPVSIGVYIYYHTESEKEPNNKAEQIGKALGSGGEMITCDDGQIWITKGNPFCTAMTDQTDKSIKIRFINLTLKYYTL